MSEGQSRIAEDEKASAEYLAFIDTLPRSARDAMLAPREPPPPTEGEVLLEAVRKLSKEVAAFTVARRTGKGGAPRKPSKAKATAIYRQERAKGRSTKDATKTANAKAGTTYKSATLKKYARENGG